MFQLHPIRRSLRLGRRSTGLAVASLLALTAVNFRGRDVTPNLHPLAIRVGR